MGLTMDDMELKWKATILNEQAVYRAIKRIAHEIIERNDGVRQRLPGSASAAGACRWRR